MNCNCENKALKIFRNYPTEWDSIPWLSILFESEAIDLTGFRATFTLGDFQKEWTDLTDGIIINLTDEETGALPVGLNYATLIVEDTAGNSKPFSTAIPVEVITWVDDAEQTLDTYNMTVNALLDNETQMVIKIETAKVSLAWVEEKIAEHNASEEAHPYIKSLIKNGVLTITQDDVVLGTFSANQEENTTIEIQSGGSNIDGGSASSVYLTSQVLDGGNAEEP